MRFRGLRPALVLSALALTGMVSACSPPLVGVVVPTSPGSGSTGGSGGSAATKPNGPLKTCDLPSASSDFERVDPAEVGLTSESIRSAITYADARGAQSVRIYRNNCLVGTSGNDAQTGWSQMPAWSMTKGVVSIVAGRAYTEGKLDLDASIGNYITGLNESQKRITVRNLLTQTSGMRFAWANDLNDASQFDSVKRLFERPFEAEPGTEFIYAQTTVTAVVAAVEAAVGEDFQAYAKREVFEPIGITSDQWTWARDGGGRTQGFAFLDMTPKAFARLGALLANNGNWKGNQILSPEYITEGRTGTPINTNYGFLWRTNLVPEGAEPSEDTIRDSIRSATPQTYWLSGLFNQNVFIVPELDIVVVRMGMPSDVFGDPIGESEGERPKWEHYFFRELLGGVTDVDIADPGPWEPTPPGLSNGIDGDHMIWIDWAGLGLG